MPSLLSNLEQVIQPYLHARRWLVAYSGGVDSHVLLHLLASLAQQLTDTPMPKLVAVHINHQLQEPALQWAEHCQQQAKHLHIPIEIVTVDVQNQPRQSLEEQARRARYSAFEALMEPGDILMLGHHRDDQVETLMQRLLRGSGSVGAAGMPQSRRIGCGQLLRPLLDIERADIEHYAAEQSLQWIEDPSNQSADFDRNFLRLELLPKLAERWPDYRQTLARAAAFNQQSAQLNAELAELDFHALTLNINAESIPISALTELSFARQKNLLRYWLAQRALPMPSAAQLQAVFDNVINAKPDADPQLSWSGVDIRRFKDQLFALSPLPDIDIKAVHPWSMKDQLAIEGLGVLSLKKAEGKGVALSHIANQTFQIRFRQGGERCQPEGRSHSQTLKKLLQEYGVETWLRDRLPLLYCQEQLVAVADLWVCQGWGANAHEQGMIIHWDKQK